MTRMATLVLLGALVGTAFGDDSAWRAELSSALRTLKISVSHTDEPLTTVLHAISAAHKISVITAPRCNFGRKKVSIAATDETLGAVLAKLSSLTEAEFAIKCGAIVFGSKKELEIFPDDGFALTEAQRGDPQIVAELEKLRACKLSMDWSEAPLDDVLAYIDGSCGVIVRQARSFRDDFAYSTNITLDLHVSAWHYATLAANQVFAEIAWEDGWKVVKAHDIGAEPGQHQWVVVSSEWTKRRHRVRLATPHKAGDSFEVEVVEPGAKAGKLPMLVVPPRPYDSPCFFDTVLPCGVTRKPVKLRVLYPWEEASR